MSAWTPLFFQICILAKDLNRYMRKNNNPKLKKKKWRNST